MEESYKFATYTNYAVYGMCSGNSTNSSQAPVPATFEGITGFSVISSETVTFTDCTPPSISATGTSYFDGNFVPVGSSINGGEYGVYLTPPVVPVSVQVGDTGTIGTKTAYSDNTKSNVVGHDDMTYVIEADTANTAMVDLITKSYDSNGVLLITTHNRFKILPAGYLIPYSVDIRSSALHLVLVASTLHTDQGIYSSSPAWVGSPFSDQVSVTFREPMDTASITNNTFSLVSSTGVAVAGSIQFSGRTATFIPSTPLADGTYTATVSKDVKSFYGMPMTSDYSWTFSWDGTAPTVSVISPANLDVDVPISTPISVTFGEVVRFGQPLSAAVSLSSVAGPISGAASLDYWGKTLTFVPDTPLLAGALYTVTISGQLTDSTLNPLGSDLKWTFTTDPTFRERAVTPLGADAAGVVIGDVNMDGRNDLVVATGQSAVATDAYKLFVYIQNAAGSLSTPVKYPTSASFNKVASSLRVGDFDNDGKNDVIALISGTNDIEVFKQKVDGTLDAGFIYTMGTSPIGIKDLNGDGLVDVVTNWQNNIGVILQGPGGTFATQTAYTINGFYGNSDFGDLNADGLIDLAIMRGASSEFCVLPQSGAGLFNPPSCYNVGAGPFNSLQSISVGDVNGDSLDDIAVVFGGNLPTSKLGVFLQNAGTLGPLVNYDSLDSPSQVAIADMTGDGLKDVIVLHDSFYKIGVYRQLSAGGLQAEKLYSLPDFGQLSKMAVGDINGDGKPDAVVVDNYNGLTILYRP
jgi:hypothetical protein